MLILDNENEKMKKLLIILSILLIASCASENEYLVNPPPRYETVNVRLLNLAGDGQSRSIVLNGETEIADVPYGMVSAFVRPPADSVSLEVRRQGTSELKASNKVRFGRNMNYTFVVLPSADGAPNHRQVDTIITFSTSIVVAQSQREAYLKLFNGNPDSTVSYSMMLGCPSGTVLANHIQYRRATAHSVVRSGEVAISIVRHKHNGDELIGLFDLVLENLGQYAIVILREGNSEKVLLLDEKNSTVQALKEPAKIENRDAHLKISNFSTEMVSLHLHSSGDVASLFPMFSDAAKKIEACGTTTKDTLSVRWDGATTAKLDVGIDVLQKYSAFVFDSANSKAKKLVFAEPVYLAEELNNRAIVRVVNGNYLQSGVSVSAGAREIANATGEDKARGFRSGDNLASGLKFGEISKPMLLEAGTLPIAVFTATKPARLITTARLRLEANKNYFIVVYSTQSGEQKVSLVEESAPSNPIVAESEGVFAQIINTIADADYVSFALPGVFSDARLNFSSALATILASGQTQLSIAGKQFSFAASPERRAMLIAAGKADAPELVEFIEPPVLAAADHYVRRFVNVSDVPKIDIKMGEDVLIYPGLAFAERTPIERIYKERKFSLTFINSETQKQIARIDDLFLTYNKTYTIIFAGNSKKGYSVIIQQEY